MLRRPIARFQTKTLALLTITGVCVFLTLAGNPSAAKVTKHHRATLPQDQISNPDNLTTTMYGGNGGHGNSDSINDGSLVTLNQTNAAVTLVGHPNSVARLTGLAFDSTGKLFASTSTGGGFPPPPPPLTSTLLVLNPANGAIVSTIGPITDGSGGPTISIADLAVQPGTDTLFGVRAPNDGGFGEGKLYTINKTTGVATLVGNTNAFFSSIGFAPDGTLYESAADLNFMTGDVINFRFMKVNPANAAIITSVATTKFFGALDVRPIDSVVFAGTGDAHQIFTVTPATGVFTLVGDTGQNFVGDIAFSPVTNVGVNAYRQTNLVSDVPFLGQILDPLLINPWGLTESASSPFWSANNVTSTATLYGGDVTGTPAFKNPLNVTIPGSLPTGTVFSGSTTDFAVTSGGVTSPARFIFASITGNIVGWRAGTSGVIAASHPGHVYTGLAIGNNGVANFLYAADFANRKIDAYDKNFALVTLAGNFTDPTLPSDYAPFNIQSLGTTLYVMYAKVDPMTGEDQAGPGNGYVSTFDANGNFLQRLVSNSALNSPWGVALAPTNFGLFGDTLLVGNFGDGRINSYNRTTGAFLGALNDQTGHVLEIEKLWAITFGNGAGGGSLNVLYFNAGIGDEEHGIFGKLEAAVTPFITFQLSSDQYVVDEGADFVTITVNRTGELNPATVNFSTYTESSPGHASPVNDFIPAGGTLRFAAGETSKSFRVLIINDTNLEGDEHFEVELSNPTGAGLGSPTHADVKIAENDSPAAISPAQKTFVASLDGGHEVPPRTTNGKATGVVIITDEATGAAKMSLTFSGLTSNAVAAHIHGPAVDGQNAAVLFPITVPAATSGSANDVPFTMTPTQISQLKNGLFYFNIHTSNFPGGEIRGQIYFNPIDEAGYFVRQNYLDFLNRNPDTPGLNYWTGQITGCGVNALCISNRRIDVSAAFFFAQEFQTTDFFVYRVRKASFGSLPTLSQFTLDRGSIASGSDADMKTFTENFVQNGEFIGVYPATLNGSAYIDKLIATVLAGSGVDLSSRKPDLENEYTQEASQTSSRARVLRRLVGYPEFITAEFNRGFVATEYYGYLRRTPDTAGFNFWLGVLNNGVPGNSRSMVCAFITSAEYQLRFGPTVTRSNVECATVAP